MTSIYLFCTLFSLFSLNSTYALHNMCAYFSSQEREIVTLYFTYICISTTRSIILGVLYGYKGVLQVIALVFALKTRKVMVKGLDDSKYIAAATYVASIVLMVIIITSYSLRGFVNVFATLFCTGFFIGNTIVLGLVFVPKVGTLSCGDSEVIKLGCISQYRCTCTHTFD